ncbi:hypothetical protein GDO78_003455 [Eleutherodactylus coqui]|uniref:Uncharacterized protein n=1 Tax=Eleutherodactylus coqui TaxID=57060 RepID=A0A8J6EUF7_ELECQ|nr:hypothetical protein GDO78_003455 [Eleutherodactylus coqui]
MSSGGLHCSDKYWDYVQLPNSKRAGEHQDVCPKVVPTYRLHFHMLYMLPSVVSSVICRVGMFYSDL